ncbi:MAG: hypothetical protein KatS3mg108_0887 [Isosphaeraceae bacterium]|jgi:hypothetical protein|nr:MAG: hypothetical protein KatS3mg108_0887 [Isosphaeraceae bacterium]
MRYARRGRYAVSELGGSGEDSFVAVVVTKLTGALLFILLLTMVIMALIPRADGHRPIGGDESARPVLEIATPERLPDAMVGRRYALALAVTGGRGDYRWSLTGELPPGMVWDPLRATIEGVPTGPTARPAVLEVSVRDGRSEARRVVELTVVDPAWSRPESADHPVVPDLRGWLERGFGYLVLLLVWLLGMNVVGSLERWSKGGIGRRGMVYRAVLSVAAMGAAGALWVWLRGPLG